MLSAPISFSTELCVLGPFLVATTPTGICAVLFGEDTVALEDDLAQRFASATRIREDNDALLGQVAASSGIVSSQRRSACAVVEALRLASMLSSL